MTLVPPLLKSGHSPIGHAVLGTGKQALAFNLLTLGLASVAPGPSQTGRGPVRHQELSITKLIDNTSPLLLKAELSGQHFNSASIVVTSRGRAYAQYTLTGVLVVHYGQQKPDGGNVPTETVTFRFASVKVQYKGPNPKK